MISSHRDINTLADLLNEFQNKENEILKKQNISHPPTIGTMYEGLTARILHMSLFENLDLRVVKNSFINGCKNEFDILLVEGEGHQLPHTESYVYNPKDVIVVIQVKKNLYSNEIIDAYKNLEPLFDLYRDYYKDNEDQYSQEYMSLMYSDSIRSILRKEAREDIISSLSREEKFVADAIAIDLYLPIRIVLGYNGFKSEFKLRKSFVKYLGTNISGNHMKRIEGFGVHNYPNLIICDKYSFIKSNGMPYGYPLNDISQWLFYSSSSYNPSKFFLEIIWTRLQYKYNLPLDIFGHDLIIEPSNPYLAGKIAKYKDSDQVGWDIEYIVLNEEQLENNNEVKNWEPFFLEELQFQIMKNLLNKGEIDICNDNEFVKLVEENSKTVIEVVSQLKNTGLVYVIENKLRPLTDFCQIGIAPDGRLFAAENKSGRLTNWLIKEKINNKT